jgi:cholest-4-en-3-one 26-monooxygenase
MSEPSVDLASPATYSGGVPHEAFRWLRANDPVSWRTDPSGKGYWAITRHRDVVEVLRDPATYSAWRGGVTMYDQPPETLAKVRENLHNRDPPDHTRLRRLVNKAFSPRRVQQLEERIAAYARDIVGRVAPRGECDFVTEVAGEMPLFVICEILGVPTDDRTRLFELTERMVSSTIIDRQAARQDALAALDELRAYGAELGRKKRQQPEDDLVSDLLTAEIEGQRLTEGEFQAFFAQLFVAGSDTTRSLLCFGLNLLLDRPAELARLRAEPGLLETAFEEVLRYESPVIQFRRTANRDTELGGRQIKEGDKVLVFFPSANRDEQVFERPEELDFTRSPNPHLSFGYGSHFCLGAPLARMESRHVLLQFLDRLHDVERASPLVVAQSNFVRGVKSLKIRFAAC